MKIKLPKKNKTNEHYSESIAEATNAVVVTAADSSTRKKKKPKINPRQEIFKCDPEFSRKNFMIIYTLSFLGFIFCGYMYQVIWPITNDSALNMITPVVLFICIVATCIFCTPRVVLAFTKSKAEEKKYMDTTTYIEQMLYSFRRNSKILASLQDTLSVFEPGDMHDKIQEAIDYITNKPSEGNIYERALDIIGDAYRCRRIKSLHRYLVKVEGAGGDHEMGINALITDRRLWMERVADFKRERGNVIKEIVVATIFSSIVVCITMRMLPAEAGAATHIVTRIFSALYIIINVINVKLTMQRTVLHLDDIETDERERELLKKLRWYKSYNKKAEEKKARKPAIILLVFGVAAFLITDKILFLFILIGLAAVAYLIKPRLDLRSTKKTLVREIEKAYPDWLMELALLLQTDNLHVAMDKTIEEAPLLLKDDLEELSYEIMTHPTSIAPYTNFMSYLPVPTIHSSMKLLYSISEFGSEEEEKQIEELVERNSILMNKAEILKNNDRLSKTYVLKFIPMGSSALKLIVDMAVFIVLFVSSSLSGIGGIF